MIRTHAAWLAALTTLGLAFAGAPPRAFAAADPASAAALARVTTLDLAWLERTVLERNPSLAAAREAWREAEARAAREGSFEDPMLDAMAAPRSFASNAVEPAWRVQVTQRFPLFGQRGLRRSAASGERRAAGYDYESARLDLLRDARVDYAEFWRITRNQETNARLRGLMKEFEHVALVRYGAGTTGQTDPLQAEVELAMLDHESVVLERARRVVVARLVALLHLPAGSELPLPPAALALPEAPSSSDWLAARARAPWPELRAAEARVEAKRASFALARRERLPESALGFAYDRYWTERELQPSAILSLSLPLNLGRHAAAVREARASLAGAEAERDAARDRVDREIESATAMFRETRHEAELVADQVVPATERSLAAVRVAYESGRGDFLALLNAVRDLHRARLSLIQATAGTHQAYADLRRALAVDAGGPETEDTR